ncbi:MAG TPA: DUF4142 domain-containing protein [Chitinophagaceae bacterium]|nr:DUF4142 domain-containing protein [Chitinophagaceae bacterium]
MKRYTFLSALVLSAGILTSCGNESGNAGTANKDTTINNDTTTTRDNVTLQLGDADREFVTKAASGGMMEVELGRMAGEKAANARVKAFGEMMVRDHSKANDELKTLAASRNIVLPDSLLAEHKEHVEAMRKMTGKAFDNHYMEMMVKDHNEDISNFEKASNNAADADLKAFATKTLPVLRMHRDSAQAINNNKGKQ